MAKPKTKPSGLSISRKDYKWTGKWKLDSKNKKEFDKQQIGWKLVKDGKDAGDTDKVENGHSTSNGQTFGEFNKKWTRNSFYPKGGPKVSAVKFRVRGGNKSGWGPWTGWKSYDLKPPRAPSLSWAYDAERHVATVTVETDAGTDACERFDTLYRIAVARADGSVAWAVNWTSDARTSFARAVDLTPYEAQLTAGKAVTATCWAYARGLAGNSGTAASSRTVAVPAPASVLAVRAPDKSASGRVFVDVAAGARTGLMQLQRRVGASGPWEDVAGASDNGSCTLHDTIAAADPQPGTRIYYRVKSTWDAYETYSEPVFAECLFTAEGVASQDGSPLAGTCGVVSLESGPDGESAVLVVGWSGACTAIEASWSGDPQAWTSTERPETFDAGWADPESASADWEYTTTLRIAGLECGSTVYVRARVRYDEDDAAHYSAYTAAEAVVPTSAPSNVSASAPAWVARGEDVPVTWTFDGGAEQTEYHVIPDGEAGTELAGGSDSLGYAAVTPEAYGDAESLTFRVHVATAGGMAASNAVSVGIADAPECSCFCAGAAAQPVSFEVYGDGSPLELLCAVDSLGNERELPDGDAPQPAGETVWTDAVWPAWEPRAWADTALYAARREAAAAARARLSDAEAALDAPDAGGEGRAAAEAELAAARAAEAQAAAELAALDPEGAVAVAEVALPEGADFVDGGTYALHVTPRDAARGLSGAGASCEFSVNWAHQAPLPADGVAVAPDAASRSVSISLPEPEGAASGDVYDVYRKNGARFELAARGVAPGSELTDPYAPYGGDSLAYRVAVRTADGDVCWEDYPYEMDVRAVRVDFGADSVELPWNLSLGSDWEKDFELRSHMDGGSAGYFGPSVRRKGSWSSDVVRADAEARAALEALGEWPGACFVRGPNGLATQCSAEPSLDEGAGGPCGASLSATAMRLTDAYRIPAGEA